MHKSNYRLRRIAYTIKNNRDYLTFRGSQPEWEHWTIRRGHIPRRWWWRNSWRQQHIVDPVLRERSRWTAEQLSAKGVLPSA